MKVGLNQDYGCDVIFTNEFGLRKGSVAFLHVSVDNLNIDFPFYNILTILQDIVGKEEGTLIFPTTQFSEKANVYLSKNKSKVAFNVKRSPSQRGLLTELARRQQGAFRSLHPTDSIVAIGKYAEEITSTHHLSEYPCGENSPYYKMLKYNAKIAGIGVSTFNLSFVHCVEDVLKDKYPFPTREKDAIECLVKDLNKEIITLKTKVASDFIDNRNISKYMKKYIANDICRDFTYKSVSFFVADAKDLFERMKELADEKITIYNA